MSGKEYSAAQIKEHLPHHISDSIDIVFFGETDSTNLRAIEYAKGGVVRETVFVANSQSAGRGRLGKSFDSRAGVGIYMTLLVRGSRLPADFVKITRYSAVKVARAIDRAAGIRTDIKWVNDIYYSGKKLAGILVQSLISESGKPEFAIIGVGVNTKIRDFPEEIKAIAGAIDEFAGGETDRSELAAMIIEELLSGIEDLDGAGVVEEYKSRSCLVGRSVLISENGAEYRATAEGVSDSGALVIRLGDGSVRELSSGDISIKIL